MEPAAGPCGTVAVEAGGVVPEVFALPVSAGLLEQAANKSTAEIAITTLNRIFEPFEPRPLGEAFCPVWAIVATKPSGRRGTTGGLDLIRRNNLIQQFVVNQANLLLNQR